MDSEDAESSFPIRTAIDRMLDENRAQMRTVARMATRPILEAAQANIRHQLAHGLASPRQQVLAAAHASMQGQVAEAGKSLQAARLNVRADVLRNAGPQEAVAREMLRTASPLRGLLAQMEADRTLRFGFTVDQIAFARRLVEATPPDVEDEVVDASNSVEVTDEDAHNIGQRVHEQFVTLGTKDAEAVFVLTYLVLFLRMVEFLLSIGVRDSTLITVLGISAHGVALKGAQSTERLYRSVNKADETDDSD